MKPVRHGEPGKQKPSWSTTRARASTGGIDGPGTQARRVVRFRA